MDKIEKEEREKNEPREIDEAQRQANELVDSLTGETDEFYKKWGATVILGGFIPAVLSLIIVFTGQLVLNTWTGTCGYSLPCKHSIDNPIFIFLF